MPMTEIQASSRSRYDSDDEEEHYGHQRIIVASHFSILEKCVFFVCFIFILLLFMFVGLFARINQALDAPSLPLPVPTIPKNETCDPTQCRTANCMTIAAEILKGVDLGLNPCDDFYAYTCTKWQENHTIPDFESRIDMQVIAKENINHRLDQILTTTQETSTLNNQEVIAVQQDQEEFALDRKLFLKISSFYQSCMNLDEITTIGLEPVFKEFRTIQHLIPLTHYDLTNKQLQKAITYLADQQIWTLFDIRIESDIAHPSKPSLYLWHGHTGLSDISLYDDSRTRSAYFHAITTTIQAVFGQDCTNEFGFNYWNALTLARRIVEFERTLLQATRFSFKDPQYTERWTIEQLQDSLPMIQWQKFLQGQQHIMVPSGDFIRNLKRQVFGTINPRTLQMYFIWRALWKYVDVLGDQYAAPKRQFQAYLQGVQDIKVTHVRRDVCIDLIDQSQLGLLLGRYFLKDREHDFIVAREKIKEMTGLLVQLIKDRVNQSEWISDEKSRLEIISKLDKIEFQIGFPDSEPNIRDTWSLTEYFMDMEIIKGDFFGNMLRNYRFESRQVYKRVAKSTFDKQFNAQSLKITYHQELNKVIIPAGLLQYPYYDSKEPLYLYIGTLGWMIGHEIMHGFDSIGRNYDQQGKFRKWLNDDISRKFEQKNQCLVDQYYQYGMDAKYSVDNNFADQGGVIFIDLLRDNTTNMSSLPGLDQWTYEQLSYIQFARMKCSKTTQEDKLIHRDYAPDNLRVNIPLINSAHFAQVFNCSKGTFMNPRDARSTCPIW